jgi:hypothetical protein
VAAAAAPSEGPGGSRACHNCGEIGHYKNGCSHLRHNSSGRGPGGGGGLGGGRTPRACYVCSRGPTRAHVAVAGRTPMRLCTAAATLTGWHGEPGACHSCAEGTQAPVVAAAAPSEGPGGSRACHNCGEIGHYKNGCPHLRRNSSRRVPGGRGGFGRGRTPMACYVCGDLTHVASQCAKRVIPVAAAAAIDVAHGENRSVGSTDFRAFEKWRSMTAAVATEAEESKEDGKWDDPDLRFGGGGASSGTSGIRAGGARGCCGVQGWGKEGKGHQDSSKGEVSWGRWPHGGAGKAGGGGWNGSHCQTRGRSGNKYS